MVQNSGICAPECESRDSLDEVVGSDGIDAITTPRTLPEYDDHTGGELHPPDENGLQDLSLGETNEGSKWYPNHEAFGPPSSVEVRCPSSTMSEDRCCGA